jgi:hypothetical protein
MRHGLMRLMVLPIPLILLLIFTASVGDPFRWNDQRNPLRKIWSNGDGLSKLPFMSFEVSEGLGLCLGYL